MSDLKTIWVLLELPADDGEPSRASLVLLSEAGRLAKAAGGSVRAVIFGESPRELPPVLGQYGVSGALCFSDPLLEYPSAEAYAAALLPRADAPWLVLMGQTALGRDLAPRLAGRLGTGAVTACTGIDITDPEHPVFSRPAGGGQLTSECIFREGRTMIAALETDAFVVAPAGKDAGVTRVIVEPQLDETAVRTRHVAYLPPDYRTVDVADTETIVAAGMGAATDELLPLVEELASLLKAAIGTTRPVVDSGKIERERMIGQTGKVVSPEVYLGLGISGASHHVGGIQEAGTILAVNRDAQASIFRNADAGAVADLREILPALINKIKQAKANGEIL